MFEFEAPEVIKVEEEEREPLEVYFEKPTVSGEVTVSFSDYVAVPISLLTWTSENDGHDAINLKYRQS